MSEKQLIRKLRKITAVMIGIGVILLVGSGLLNASLGRVQKRTMTSQMMSEAEEYQAGVLRKVNSDLQTLQTLASFFKFSNTIDKIDAEALPKVSMNPIIITALFGWGISHGTERDSCDCQSEHRKRSSGGKSGNKFSGSDRTGMAGRKWSLQNVL